MAYEIGLCNWLGGPSLFKLLNKIQKWTLKTYEGKKIPFSFLFDYSNTAKAICGFESTNYIDFLDSSHSAAFTDGISSALALTYDGRICKYMSPFSGRVEYSKSAMIFAAYRFCDFAGYCCEAETIDGRKASWLGIVAQDSGDILIFKRRKLAFVKKNGKWFFIDDYRIRNKIESNLNVANEEKTNNAKEIFLSLLDVAFSHTGGCIAIIRDEHISEIKKNNLSKDDDIEGEISTDIKRGEKRKTIQALVKAGNINGADSFFKLDRKLRHELLGLDGATLIDNQGRIIATGAIVRVNGGSDSGGRKAAAMELSKYGLAVKISMDGFDRRFQRRKPSFYNANVDRSFILVLTHKAM